jgi:hypothetical protein
MSTNTATARTNKKNNPAARTESEPAAAGPTPAAPAPTESATAPTEPSAAGPAAPTETTDEQRARAETAASIERAERRAMEGETDVERAARLAYYAEQQAQGTTRWEYVTRWADYITGRRTVERATERARAETAAHLAAGDASAAGVAAAIAAHAGARGAVIDAAPAGDLITAILKRENGPALLVRAALEKVPFRVMQSALSDAGQDVRERIGAALTGAALLDLFPSDDVTGALVASVNPFRRARPTEYSMEAASEILREGYALADLSGEDARGLAPMVKGAIKIVKNAAAAAGDLRTFAVKGAETGHKGFPPAALMFCAALDSLALMTDSDTSKSLAARKALAKAGAGTIAKGAAQDSARREGARAAAQKK